MVEEKERVGWGSDNEYVGVRKEKVRKRKACKWWEIFVCTFFWVQCDLSAFEGSFTFQLSCMFSLPHSGPSTCSLIYFELYLLSYSLIRNKIYTACCVCIINVWLEIVVVLFVFDIC